jgi:hypothetical protein
MNMNQDPRGWNSCISQTLSISPYYQHLDACMQSDPALMQQRSWVDADQPNLILFIATINQLVFEEPECELAAFYPMLTLRSRPLSEMYPVFRAFCLAHAAQLQTVLPHVRLQTSEPGRCTALLPAFERVAQLGGRHPLSLIESGSSAGLLLNW